MNMKSRVITVPLSSTFIQKGIIWRKMMQTQDSTAISIALTHLNAWSNHDWEKTRELLAPNVHAVVTTTDPTRSGSEFTGIDNYMERKIKGAQLIEPGSAHVI